MRGHLVLALFIAGCNPNTQEEMTIKRVLVHDVQELRLHCGNDLIVDPLGCAKGGAMSTPKSSSCTIYALQPTGYDDHRLVETQGHELKHCFEGPVHT